MLLYIYKVGLVEENELNSAFNNAFNFSSGASSVFLFTQQRGVFSTGDALYVVAVVKTRDT